MSTRHIPYPPDFDIDYHADLAWQCRQRALKALEVGDVLSTIDDLISQEPAPERHPCFPLVAWLLDRQLTPGDGGAFWNAWKALAC
jgi:hypothetical protein